MTEIIRIEPLFREVQIIMPQICFIPDQSKVSHHPCRGCDKPEPAATLMVSRYTHDGGSPGVVTNTKISRTRLENKIMAKYQQQFTEVINKAIKGDFLNEDNPWAYFIDQPRIIERCKDAKMAFPRHTRHCFALKANPCPAVLEFIVKLGFGLECASAEEVAQALKTSVSPSDVVFDGPCKTPKEIAWAIRQGVYLNVDNLDELSRVKAIVATLDADDAAKVRVGVRINPQVGGGSIAATSTATAYAKFGIPIKEQKDALIAAVLDCTFVCGLHCHIGSGGMGFAILTEGIQTIVALAEELRGMGKAIEAVDIGGGVPIEYNSPQLNESPSFDSYYKALRAEIGSALDNYTLITEFGRALIGHAGTILSRVEYARTAGGRHISTLHFGADMMVWTTYTKEHMLRLPFAVYGGDGAVKFVEGVEEAAEDDVTVDLVGPLCFSYDTVGFERRMPATAVPVVGDHVAMFNAGAYTFAVWSKFNSRATPRIVMVNGDEMTIVKEKESLEANLGFWG